MTILLNEWRTQCKDLRSRGKQLWVTNQWTDCELVVGTKESNRTTVRAHRLILTMASPVLEEYLQAQDPQPIDVDVSVFNRLLMFIYTDEIVIDSLEMAFAMGKAALKFKLDYLVTAIAKYLESKILSENVCKIFEFSQIITNGKLMYEALKYIRENVVEIIDHSSFIEISFDTLETICAQTMLSMPHEIVLFNAIQKYYDSSNLIKKDKVKELVKYIRFLTILPEEFILGPGRSSLLSKSESHDILSKLIIPMDIDIQLPQGFSKETAKRNKSIICTRTPGLIRDLSCILNGTNLCTTTFQINAHAKLHAIQLPTVRSANKIQRRYEENVKVFINHIDEDTRSVAEQIFTTRHVTYNSIQNVYLRKPFTIERNKTYCISVAFLNSQPYSHEDTQNDETQRLGIHTIHFQICKEKDYLPGLIHGIELEILKK